MAREVSRMNKRSFMQKNLANGKFFSLAAWKQLRSKAAVRTNCWRLAGKEEGATLPGEGGLPSNGVRLVRLTGVVGGS